MVGVGFALHFVERFGERGRNGPEPVVRLNRQESQRHVVSVIVDVPLIDRIDIVGHSVHDGDRFLHKSVLGVFPPVFRFHHHFSLKQSQFGTDIIGTSRFPFQFRVRIATDGSRIFAEVGIKRLLGNNHDGALVFKHVALIAERGFQAEEIQPLRLFHSRQFRHVPVGGGGPDGQEFVVALVAESVGTVHSAVGVHREIVEITVGHGEIAGHGIVSVIR